MSIPQPDQVAVAIETIKRQLDYHWNMHTQSPNLSLALYDIGQTLGLKFALNALGVEYDFGTK